MGAERIRIPRITIIRITTKSFWWNTIRRKRRTRYYCITHGGISIRLTVTDNFAITDLRIVPRYFTTTKKNAKLPTGYETKSSKRIIIIIMHRRYRYYGTRIISRYRYYRNPNFGWPKSIIKITT